MFGKEPKRHTNTICDVFQIGNKSLLFMIKNLDSHVPHNYHLLTPHGWIPNEHLPNAYTHTYLTTTTIDGWQMGFTYVKPSHD